MRNVKEASIYFRFILLLKNKLLLTNYFKELFKHFQIMATFSAN